MAWYGARLGVEMWSADWAASSRRAYMLGALPPALRSGFFIAFAALMAVASAGLARLAFFSELAVFSAQGIKVRGVLGSKSAAWSDVRGITLGHNGKTIVLVLGDGRLVGIPGETIADASVKAMTAAAARFRPDLVSAPR